MNELERWLVVTPLVGQIAVCLFYTLTVIWCFTYNVRHMRAEFAVAMLVSMPLGCAWVGLAMCREPLASLPSPWLEIVGGLPGILSLFLLTVAWWDFPEDRTFVINGTLTTAKGGFLLVLRPKSVQELPKRIQVEKVVRYDNRTYNLYADIRLTIDPEMALTIAREHANPDAWMRTVVTDHAVQYVAPGILRYEEDNDLLSRDYTNFDYPHLFGDRFRAKQASFHLELAEVSPSPRRARLVHSS